MALAKGNSGCTTGLSKRIYDNRMAAKSTIGISDSATAALKADCYAIACAVVDEITANAVVTVSAAGLQTTTALGAPTGPPAAPVNLTVA